MKIRLLITSVVTACSLHVLPAIADDAAAIAEIKSAVLQIDKAYADEDVSTIERMILPKSGLDCASLRRRGHAGHTDQGVRASGTGALRLFADGRRVAQSRGRPGHFREILRGNLQRHDPSAARFRQRDLVEAREWVAPATLPGDSDREAIAERHPDAERRVRPSANPIVGDRHGGRSRRERGPSRRRGRRRAARQSPPNPSRSPCRRERRRRHCRG